MLQRKKGIVHVIAAAVAETAVIRHPHMINFQERKKLTPWQNY